MTGEDLLSSPCELDWSELRPTEDHRRRYCEHCDAHVHHLSRMSLDEAEELLRANPGRLCVAAELVPVGQLTRARGAATKAAAASLALVLGGCAVPLSGAHGPDELEQIEQIEPVEFVPNDGLARQYRSGGLSLTRRLVEYSLFKMRMRQIHMSAGEGGPMSPDPE